MSALAMSFVDERIEERLDCVELETLSFRVEGGHIQRNINVIVQDKSNSGLGCYCAPSSELHVGAFLNLWDLVVYEIRWLQHVTDNIVNMGLLMVEEVH